MNSNKYSSLLYCIAVVVTIVALLATLTCGFITTALFLNAGRYGVYLVFTGAYGFAALTFGYYAFSTYKKGRVKKDLIAFLRSRTFLWIILLGIALIFLGVTVGCWMFTINKLTSESYLVAFFSAVLASVLTYWLIIYADALKGMRIWHIEGGGSDPLRYLSD